MTLAPSTPQRFVTRRVHSCHWPRPVTPGFPFLLPPYRPFVSIICLCKTCVAVNRHSGSLNRTPIPSIPLTRGPPLQPRRLPHQGWVAGSRCFPIRAPPASARRHPAGFIFPVSAFLRPGSGVFTWRAACPCPCPQPTARRSKGGGAAEPAKPDLTNNVELSPAQPSTPLPGLGLPSLLLWRPPVGHRTPEARRIAGMCCLPCQRLPPCPG